ncbi:hypothetical protein SAMN04488029_3002 [Reichenbachiella faecimaris]|uniref:Uncharacterized protein n=1 Tax=Reichenbachiella faecimaris TaxID=692418 RepID=A0A1W2GIY4_REIFA|nr:hypothetical protein [Reichenbachiella faecimaris]SMD36639.1 hypothetical protein SAMN04488029_3002 [Reichenbachiella faecimaris]
MEALLISPVENGGMDVSTVYRSEETRINPPYYVVISSTIFKNSFDSYPNQVMELMAKVNKFSNFEENWDTYGASEISKVSINNALSFLKDNSFLSLPFYFAAPGVNGEVMIEFKEGNKGAEIYFNGDGSNELLIFEKHETIFESNVEMGMSQLIKFFN